MKRQEYTSIFSMYGGKAKIAHVYPQPIYPVIVEPFAGSASYSALYYTRKVILFDIDERIAAIWQFLLSKDAMEWLRCIPESMKRLDHVDTILYRLCPDAPEGLLYLLRSYADRGTMGKRINHTRVSVRSEGSWLSIRNKLYWWIPRIRHWEFYRRNWYEIDVGAIGKATWFVDPPYSTGVGKRYRHRLLNYEGLGEWCRNLPGQVIVCEGDGATWLPFKPIKDWFGMHRKRGEAHFREAVWINYNPPEENPDILARLYPEEEREP